MKKPYLKIRTKYGKSIYSVTEMSIDENNNPDWWPNFVDEIKLSFMDEDMTSISIRRLQK